MQDFIDFIKDNSYNMVKMFIYQFGMTVFGLTLSLATASNDTLLLIAGCFSVLFYMYLLYTMTWELGAKDRVRIDSGRVTAMPLKGLYISIGANTINIILGLLIVIGYFSVREWIPVVDPASGATVMTGEPLWAINLYGTAKTIDMLLHGMYTAFIRLYMSENPFAYLIIILPALIICTVGYLLGSRNFKLIKTNINASKLKKNDK